MQLCGNGYFRYSFSANSCLILLALLKPEVWSVRFLLFCQEALPTFWLISLLTISNKYWWNLAATLEKLNQQIHFGFMGTCKCDVVTIIKMGAYIHRVLLLMLGCTWWYQSSRESGCMLSHKIFFYPDVNFLEILWYSVATLPYLYVVYSCQTPQDTMGRRL